MSNLLFGLEPSGVLHVALLLAGLATFIGVLAYVACPHCSWAEWIGDGAADDQE